MADKQIKKLSNIYFYGVSFDKYDTVDITADIITNIRKRFLVTKKPASNKLYRASMGESFVYSYNFSFDRPLQWKVTKNKRVIEEIIQLHSGKYCVNFLDEQGRDLKKVFFDSKHRWFKTNYYSSVSNENLACSLVPKEFDEGTSILKYVTGEIYPQRLFSCSVPSCEEVRSKLLSRIPTPTVTALTDRGVVYFLPEEDRENYEYILSEEEENYKALKSPEVFVSQDDIDSGFRLSVNDFDMSKNLNRTFDISLAKDFDADSETYDDSVVSEAETEIPLTEPVSVDDGSVDAAITHAVEQINSKTSLGIDASDILNIQVGSLEKSHQESFDESDDYITFNNTDSAIDKQLEHIDSVLDGSSLLNSERKLVIGDSVVDDDYISSIIDGIISSAFVSDEDTDTLEEAVDEELAADTDVSDAYETDNSDEINITEASETDITDDAVNDIPYTPSDEKEDIPEYEEMPHAYSTEDYIKQNPADSIIESRGEAYFYYGNLDENGKRTGRGRTLMSDGSIAYEGEYEDDKRKGVGSFYFKDGSLCYWGNWDNNIRSGYGVGVNSEDKAVHVGGWKDNKPFGLGARFDNEGNLMFLSSSCEDKKKGITISDISDSSFTVRVWSEDDEAFIQREISINDIIK